MRLLYLLPLESLLVAPRGPGPSRRVRAIPPDRAEAARRCPMNWSDLIPELRPMTTLVRERLSGWQLFVLMLFITFALSLLLVMVLS